MNNKLIVIAIGGNSLIEDPKHVSVDAQYNAAKKTAVHIASLVKEGNRVVIAHGNGPQVGFILLRAEHSKDILHGVPLDSCVADTQGAIGYQLQMALDNEFKKLGIEVQAVTIVTQVEVDKNDPSFHNPTKPIGSFMEEKEALSRKEKLGWAVVEDAGRGWRRVVASPKPKKIIELETIKKLQSTGACVIAAGGGGIPVINEDGQLKGVEAVIDKDLAASLMAEQLGADLFVISTAVKKVCLNFGKPDQVDLDSMNTEEAKKYIEEGHFAPGSMLPKIQALVHFVEKTGNCGIVTDPSNLYDAVYGDKGTKICKKKCCCC